MTDLPNRMSLEVKALALAQIPQLARFMGSWCGRHLATEDLYELVQWLEECRQWMQLHEVDDQGVEDPNAVIRDLDGNRIFPEQ